MNKFCLWTIVFLAVGISNIFAAPAAPVVSNLIQPDGTVFSVRARGDEFSNWVETTDGHTVIKVKDTWYYAQKDGQGGIEPSDQAVGNLTALQLEQWPRHLAPARSPEHSKLLKIRKLYGPDVTAGGSSSSFTSATHSQYVLTILVDYADVSIASTDASFSALMYGANNSVKHFYLENSYGGLTIQPPNETFGTANDGIVRVSRPVSHPNQGSDNAVSQSEAQFIVQLADAYINYADYDSNNDGEITTDELAIVIITAGYETSFGGAGVSSEPGMWGHAWGFIDILMDGKEVSDYTMFGELHGDANGEHQATIGIMCHELGHLILGLPDLYDTKQVATSAGIGTWGLMGGGSWNWATGFIGSSPAHLSAWSKIATQFTVPVDIDIDQLSVNIAQAAFAADAKRIWIDQYKLNEYFLIENRQKSGYDAGLPGAGMLIWHIDEWQDSNQDETHKWVDLEEADGLAQLDDLDNFNSGDEGDAFPGSANNTEFSNSSNPDSKDYAGEDSGISVTNISASNATMTADFIRAGGDSGDHVSYDTGGHSFLFGFGVPSAWMAVEALNDTGFSNFDGVDIYIGDPIGATVSIYYYTSLTGGLPADLIYSQTGMAIGSGWNRLLIDVPQAFPMAVERGIVVEVVNNTLIYPIAVDASSAPSGRSYYSADGVGTFFSTCDSADTCGDVNLRVLLSDGVVSSSEIFEDGFE